MSSNNEMFLLTSISPRLKPGNLDYQRLCIASWRSAGFKLATVNGRSEENKIKSLDLDLDIIVTDRDGKPAIREIVDIIIDKSGRFGGIINADCMILPYPDLARRLTENLSKRMFIVERVDEDDRLMPQADSCSGFDAFFFDKSILPHEIHDDFKIGVPWWDYYLPMAAAQGGAELIAIDTPLITHRLHDNSWNNDELLRVGQNFWKRLNEMRSFKPVDSILKSSLASEMKYEDLLDINILSNLSFLCFKWLQSHRISDAKFFTDNEYINIVNLIQRYRYSLNANKYDFDREFTSQHIKFHEMKLKFESDIIDYMEKLSKMNNRAELAEREIEQIHASTSWRITKPLRQFSYFIKGRHR
jgi:hypothetical protein